MRSTRTVTIDLFKPFWFVAVILLMVGTIPFTPVAVGILLLLSEVGFTLSWTR